MVNILDDVL